ncbi:hypothetical protein pdam_00012991 [Pocillopora damicornis]|uniref:G-protein coupled receptors family 1 profile domain-containing protein n=1 Tax=Pocillopora damicornis TaxID=46731 RepID=A0A3M6U5K3_POCDA|nr:hypothetical protein pdam_00012991 [Pocillopora damicornis]
MLTSCLTGAEDDQIREILTELRSPGFQIARSRAAVRSPPPVDVTAMNNIRNYAIFDLFCKTLWNARAGGENPFQLYDTQAAAPLITAISIDRYFAIYFHLRYSEIVTEKRARIALVCIWFISGIGSIAWSSGNVAFSQVMLVVTTVCLVAMFYTWTKIYQVMRRHQAQIHEQRNTPPHLIDMCSIMAILGELICLDHGIQYKATTLAYERLSTEKNSMLEVITTACILKRFASYVTDSWIVQSNSETFEIPWNFSTSLIKKSSI